MFVSMSHLMDVDHPLYATRLFSRAPVYDLVFSCLSPRSLARTSLACRLVYSAVASFKNRAFNVNRHFFRFFSDPLAFRSLQAKTNTLVSGSSALQFLDRSFYPEADLDLYTHPGHSLEVAQFLVDREGYTYVPRDTQEEDWKTAVHSDWDGTERRAAPPGYGREHAYPMTDIREVWSFQKTGRNDDERLTVQIVEAASSPFECIMGFHSTCVMNFISSDAAYALYPVATFEERSALGMPGHTSAPIQKYLQRGWRVYFYPRPDDCENSSSPPFMLSATRWVGDRHTWVLPLDQTGVAGRPPLSEASEPLACDPALFNGWCLALEGKSHGCGCQYFPLQSTMFRYNYAIPDEKTAMEIRSWTWMQGKHSHEHISKENWVWFDADLPAFLKRK